MTTKQIADLCEVSTRTVRRWVDRLSGPPGQNVRSLPPEKMKLLSAGEAGRTVDWSEEEVFLILEAGGRGSFARWMQRTRPGVAEDRLDRLETLVERLLGAVVALVPEARASAPRDALPAPAELQPRSELLRLVKLGARKKGDFRATWNDLYEQFDLRYHRNLRLCAKNRGIDTLDYVEDENLMGELLVLAYLLYGGAA